MEKNIPFASLVFGDPSCDASLSFQFDDPLEAGGMGMDTCSAQYGNEKTSDDRRYILCDEGLIIHNANLTPPWKKPRLLVCGDVAPEIGLDDMDESEPEATIDEIEEMGTMQELETVTSTNGLGKHGQQRIVNEKDDRPKDAPIIGVYVSQEQNKNTTCATHSNKVKIEKSWKYPHRYSGRGAETEKRRGTCSIQGQNHDGGGIDSAILRERNAPKPVCRNFVRSCAERTRSKKRGLTDTSEMADNKRKKTM